MVSAHDMVVTGVTAVTPRGQTLKNALAWDHPSATTEGWFDVKARLGRHGYKYLPPACQYLLAAGRGAIDDAGDALESVAPEARGAVVGINSAASALHADMDRAIVTESADALSPIGAPFFSINLFSSRLATEHELKAFNLTTMSPRVAALEALEIGLRCVGLGRASWLLAGATEAPLAAGEPGAADSECGAVALVLEPASAALRRGARVYGRFGVRTAFLAPAVAGGRDGRERAAEIVRDSLRALGAVSEVAMADAVAVVDDSPVGRAVIAALGDAVQRVTPGAGCLEPLLQAAGLLTGSERERALVTAATEGNIAIALLTPAEALGASERSRQPVVRLGARVA